MPLRIAMGAMVVDVTIGVITKVFFILISSVLFIAATGRTELTRPALIAVLTRFLHQMVVWAEAGYVRS